MTSWDSSIQGLIHDVGSIPLGGHLVKVAGFSKHKQDGSFVNPATQETYLVIQNSWGINAPGSDSGLYYFSRDISNKVFGEYGIGYWSDDPNLVVKKMGLLSALYVNLVNWLKQLVAQKDGTYPPKPPVAPVAPPVAPEPPQPTVPHPLILALSQGIFEAEGNGKQLGALNDNWGDLRYTKYTQSLGATGIKNGFAVFPSRAVGDKACYQLCLDVANNLLLGYPKPCSIKDFVKVYGEPQTQLEWDNYVSILCARTGKIETTTLTEML